MKLWSGFLAMLGLASTHNSAPEAGDPRRPYIAPETLREHRIPVVFRGGRRHTRNALECPACRTTTARYGQCLNRACSQFNGTLARTNPDLLSLDRASRVAAQLKWAHGV
jgi:hypothetical protein